MRIQVYLNESRDHYLGFHPENQPAMRLALAFDMADCVGMGTKDGVPVAMLEHVFEQLNIGGDLIAATQWTEVYRRNHNRSLSVGDVVTVGELAYAVGSVGWQRVTTDDLLDGINRYQPVPHHGGVVMSRPLGKTQLAVLHSMTRRHYDSTWYVGCGWLWSTPSETTKLMESLVKRGLVDKTVVHMPANPLRYNKAPYDRTVYTINDAGRMAVSPWLSHHSPIGE